MHHRFKVVSQGRIEIGIDVGWSKVKRSCALAVRGLEWEGAGAKLYMSPGGVEVARIKLFRLEELVPFLRELVVAIRDHLDHTTLVVDGPLGGDGRPVDNRRVDAECRRGGLHLRVQPNDVTGEAGRKYVESTYRIVDPFLDAAGVSPWVGRNCSSGQLVVAETNPTVAMALMLPMQGVETLPSRQRPLELPPPPGKASGRVISAKSDWYWRIGVGRRVAGILGSPAVAVEEDHERVAGLFCLGLATMLDAADPDATRALPIGIAEAGRPDGGIYLVPRALPDCWNDDVNRVGLPWASPEFSPYSEMLSVPAATRRLRPLRVTQPPAGGPLPAGDPFEAEPDEGPQDDEERFLLLLNDIGGVWTKSNSWLGGLSPDVRLRALDGMGEVFELTPSVNFPVSGQWKISKGDKALALARARNFRGGHLSGEQCVSLDVEILADGVDGSSISPEGS